MDTISPQMKVKELFKIPKPLISFEFFPPKTDEGKGRLFETISSLKSLKPSFVSMTYGAGGSTRQKTVELVSHIKHRIGLEAVAHLTCVGQTKNDIQGVLEELTSQGIENIMALRGDPPQGHKTFVKAEGGFQYASELVGYIKSRFDFCLGVAGYPEKHLEAPTMEEDLQHLKEKVDAGGDFVVTQLFFDNADYYRYVDMVRKKGVRVPVVAGLMPIQDYSQILRFTAMCGSKIPAFLMEQLNRFKDIQQKISEIGIDHTTQQCEDLLKKGVPGIHFYTLNKSQATLEIFRRLRAAKLVPV